MYQDYVFHEIEIIFSQSLIHYQHIFPTLRETLYDGRVKFLAVASELFRLDVVRKTVSSEYNLQDSIETEFGDEDSSTGLAEIFEFVALTSLISSHFAPNWLQHLSPRIPLKSSLHSPRRRCP